MQKAEFKTWKTIDGIEYPYRLSLEGWNLRRWFFKSDRTRYGYAFSDHELGFEFAWQRKEVLDMLKAMFK
jgi:hypothetical protein